jgi:hypothetical protein
LGNNICILKSGQIIKIQKLFLSENQVLCKATSYCPIQPFFTIPEDSTLVVIGVVKETSEVLTVRIEFIERRLKTASNIGKKSS